MSLLKEEFDDLPRSGSVLSSSGESIKKDSNGKSGKGSPKGDGRSSLLNSEEERQIKRQRRLVKNRESAQLSRMRKKIYMEDLETKVNALTTENTSLKGEVAQLQNIIKQMRQQQDSNSNNSACVPATRHISPPSRNAQAGICLLIVLFSLGLLVNVVGNGNILSRAALPSNDFPRPRRESPLITLVDTSNNEEHNLNGVDKVPSPLVWDDDSDMDDEVVSTQGTKRINPDDDDEEDDQEPDAFNHKRVRIREDPLPIVETSGIVEESEMWNLNTDDPVAIALLIPAHPRQNGLSHLTSSLSSFGNLNVHVWPLSR